MMKPTVQITQWGLLSVLTIIGGLCFFLVIGDENPEQPMTLSQFLAIKGIAFAGLVICAKTGKRLYKTIQKNSETQKEEHL